MMTTYTECAMKQEFLNSDTIPTEMDENWLRNGLVN